MVASTNPAVIYVKDHLSPATVASLSSQDKKAAEAMVITDLNKFLADPAFYETSRFADLKLNEYTTDLIKEKHRSEYATQCLNRSLLETVFPDSISRSHNQTAESIHGFRVTSGIVVGILFALCSALLACYQLNKHTTLEMANELAERRRKLTAA